MLYVISQHTGFGRNLAYFKLRDSCKAFEHITRVLHLSRFFVRQNTICRQFSSSKWQNLPFSEENTKRQVQTMIIEFLILSIGLGIGLAMDAFSVSIANGLKEPNMSLSRHAKMAGIYAFFQFAMPLIGWLCVHTIQTAFVSFQKFIPWIALLLLLYIGIQMIIDGIKGEDNAKEKLEEDLAKNDKKISTKTLLIQGIATSIDALSVGFAIASYSALKAFICGLIIAVVTFFICMLGVKLGKLFGCKLHKYANFLGGGILIAIGLEIFIKSFI